MTENQKLREALQVARDHIDMDALEISHCKDATLIRQALALSTADHLPDAGEMVVDHFPDATKMIETATPVGERELFERTMMDKYGWQHEDFKLDDFGYADGQTDTAWMAWQARASLSAGDAGWQPIETAPMDGRLGLVYRPLAANTRDEPIAIKSLIGGDRFCWPNTAPKGSAPTNPTDGACHVTHWMPLPPAPAMRKDKP